MVNQFPHFPVEALCQKHLGSAHVESHMLLGSLKRRRQITKHVEFDQVEVESIKKRHDELAKEMSERGYNHKSDLENVDKYITHLPEDILKKKANRGNVVHYLLYVKRCPECRKRYAIYLRRSIELGY
ncbi:pyrimidine dimer DNA glycosylase/endonuclease V [Methanococcus voltae]|uniref:Uncharacterized protein n=1 Tax=Methanococcus voltae (strain ATCC BAA-1334 / A3) TaxID=456320 RepID=D7DSY0_METV3|nr:pyrimidine dimer DNA glycosylase/endonuclease V [Methanococcus voltae]MCS3901869.1 hypothetical protein [Methanococcus voltae]